MTFESKTFNIEVSVQEDVTAFSNRFYLQCEDTLDENHSWLKEFKDKHLLMTCIVVEIPLSSKECRE